jgi:hypothetical protein
MQGKSHGASSCRPAGPLSGSSHIPGAATRGPGYRTEDSLKLPLHIRGPACGSGVVVERGEQGFQVCRDHLRGNRLTRLPWLVGGGSQRHESTHVQVRGERADTGNVAHYTEHMFSIQEKSAGR